MGLPEKSIKKQPNYMGVFLILVLLTAVEVAVTYLPIPRILVSDTFSICKSQPGGIVFHAS